MEEQGRRFRLTAAQLRWTALGAMLLDHLWAMVVPGVPMNGKGSRSCP